MDSVVNCSIIACRTEIVEVVGEHFTRGNADDNGARITECVPLRAAVDRWLGSAVWAFRHLVSIIFFYFFLRFREIFLVFIKNKKKRLHMDFFSNSSTTPQCSSHIMCLSRSSSCSSLHRSRQHSISQTFRSISEYETFILQSTSPRPTRSLSRTLRSSRTCRNQLSTRDVHSYHLISRSASCPADFLRGCFQITAVRASF